MIRYLTAWINGKYLKEMKGLKRLEVKPEVHLEPKRASVVNNLLHRDS